MMYDLVITCAACGAVHSVSGLAEQPLLSAEQVLEQARHSPECLVASTGKGQVQETPRLDEPHVALYAISEVS